MQNLSRSSYLVHTYGNINESSIHNKLFPSGSAKVTILVLCELN